MVECNCVNRNSIDTFMYAKAFFLEIQATKIFEIKYLIINIYWFQTK